MIQLVDLVENLEEIQSQTADNLEFSFYCDVMKTKTKQWKEKWLMEKYFIVESFTENCGHVSAIYD